MVNAHEVLLDLLVTMTNGYMDSKDDQPLRPLQVGDH